MSHPFCNPRTKVMSWIVLAASLAHICPGCGSDSKVQQVKRGIENVELHAERIEGEAGSGNRSASKR
jgi:hypothetical protein